MMAAPLPERLMRVLGELTDVVLEENAIMAEGVPAGVVATLGRKRRLTGDYERLCAELAAGRRGGLGAEPALAGALIVAVMRLREATSENLARLEAAMDASRRRVDAVMAAMRSQDDGAGHYGPGGSPAAPARRNAVGRDLRC